MTILIIGIVCILVLGWLHALDLRDLDPSRRTSTRAQRRAWKRERLPVVRTNRRLP